MNKLQQHKIFQWQASEIPEPESLSRQNKIIIFGILFFLIILSLFLKNFLLFLFLILFSGVIILLRRKKLPEVEIEISKQGIKYGDKFYSYGALEEFWIVYQPPKIKTLTLKLKRNFFNELTIDLAEEDPDQIRNFLLNYLKENPEITEESIEEKILKWLGI